MESKLIRQLEMIKTSWKKYKPISESDRKTKEEMMGLLKEHISDCREELLDQEELNNLAMELNSL
jgi:hypothetical protein